MIKILHFSETLFCDKNYFSLRKHCVAGFFIFMLLLQYSALRFGTWFNEQYSMNYSYGFGIFVWILSHISLLVYFAVVHLNFTFILASFTVGMLLQQRKKKRNSEKCNQNTSYLHTNVKLISASSADFLMILYMSMSNILNTFSLQLNAVV